MQENDLEASVKVHKGENVVYVRFMSNLFLEPNRAVLKPGGREEILDHVGVALAQVEHIARFYTHRRALLPRRVLATILDQQDLY